MVQVYGLYVATVVGALALFLMMPRRGYNPRKIGALLGAATLGGVWLWLGTALFRTPDLGISRDAMAYYYVFSAIGLGAAVRVITHTKPVYSALWFVMVMLSTAGMLMVLSADFIAFGMVIIYGGAILVTYVFVIMLASQSEEAMEAGEDGENPASKATEYERISRDPHWAIFAGFLLLATLLDVAFRPMEANPKAMGLSSQQIVEGVKDDAKNPPLLTHRTEQQIVDSISDAKTKKTVADFITPGEVDNVERIGLDLFRGHPLGLELAGIILLVSLIGAVVIARQRGDLETK
jgi:NADH-quinone oxidoreductase subunit J